MMVWPQLNFLGVHFGELFYRHSSPIVVKVKLDYFYFVICFLAFA
ncbi:MAG: hypothetical protein UW46_C0004G0093 [Candidatus Yanofskybacteria bacterium GW2011_GWF1_44_227]|nr:MAG: hypothetical protein UW46_C0004G0093 [Candidatus Yanofskybacteria bacterium GW2011_GWF1_44_227]